MPARERLVLAISAVTSSTKACADHGDDAMFGTLSRYYALGAEAAESAGGRVVKVMGDTILMSFPPARVQDAVETLRSFRERASTVFQDLDSRCVVQVKVGIGTVSTGLLGPPGDERFDIVGDALNRLFKEPWDDFRLTPEIQQLLC